MQTYFEIRKSGIPQISGIPWGTHFCQFFKTQKDLLEILVPYFKAGLENNEYCIWVASGSVDLLSAKKAMKKAVPNFSRYESIKQIEIISEKQWAAKVLPGIVTAVKRGFDGLRFSCDATPDKKRAGTYLCPGNEAIGGNNAIGLYTYPRGNVEEVQISRISKKHYFTLLRTAGKWKVIVSREAQIARDARRRSEKDLRSVFGNMTEGFAYHRIVLDAKGKPCDYIFLEVNKAYEKLTELKKKNIIGKKFTEVFPGAKKATNDWIEKYGEVAATCRPLCFVSHSFPLNKWFSVSAFSSHKGYFAAILTDVTGRISDEEKISSAHEELTSFNEELATMNEELSASNEELRIEVEERHRAEKALKKSEVRYRSYVEVTGQFAWVTNSAGEIEEDTPYLREFTGQTYEEAKGNGWAKALHPDDINVAIKAWKGAVTAKKPYESEYRMRRHDGQYRHMLARGVPVFNKDKEVLEWVGVCIDITERKFSEEALKKSEKGLNRAQEIARLGSWELDLENNRLSWSDETYRIFGLKSGEFSGTYDGFLERVHPDDRAAVDREYTVSLSENRDSFEIQHRIVSKDSGEIRFVHEKCSHVHDSSGKITGSVGMVQDVTEQKIYEEKINHFASFPLNNPNPILEIDADGNIIFSNQSVHKVFEDSNTGVDMNLFLPADFDKMLVFLRIGEKKIFSREVLVGSSIFLETVTVMPDMQVVRIYAQDITERIRASEKLMSVNEKLAEMNEELSSMNEEILSSNDELKIEIEERQKVEKALKWTEQRNLILSESAARLLAADDLQAVIDFICYKTMTFLECQVFFNYLAVRGTKKLRLNAYDGISHEEAERINWLDYGVAVCGCVAQTGERIIARNICSSADVRTELVRGYGVRAYCCHPLKAGDETLGTISFGTTGRDQFAENEIDMMKATADLVAVAIKRKYNLEELNRLNRTLKAHNRSNQAIMRIEDEKEYLKKVCDIIVKDCGYTMTWIGFAENDEKKSVRPVAQAGFEEGYIGTLDITWEDSERGRGPTGTAVRTGKVCMCRNMLTDPQFLPWREQAIKRGYASSIVFPLRNDSGIYGALTIYAKDPDPFMEDDVKLLEALANDISFGIISVRMRAENKKAVIILERDNDMLEKLAEEKTKELFDTHNELEKTKRLSDIGTLAATVAHELRNPLAAIGMAAYNIRRKAANAAIDSHITNIEKKVNESDQIINNLLFYSRIRPPRYEIIDFFDIIAECAAGAEEKCKGRVRIVSDIDMLKNVPIEADPIQMREVINNILNNAIDAVPVPKGFVNIIGEDRSNCICAVFKDNGHGIEAESLAKVFDPFFTTRAKGTGLGLSVCRQIVDLHGGAIEISSNPGEGTSVTVTLPKKKGM